MPFLIEPCSSKVNYLASRWSIGIREILLQLMSFRSSSVRRSKLFGTITLDLLDLNSSSCFFSNSLANKLKGPAPPPPILSSIYKTSWALGSASLLVALGFGLNSRGKTIIELLSRLNFFNLGYSLKRPVVAFAPKTLLLLIYFSFFLIFD